jgi:Family of unknown function (DUF6502)
MSKPKSAVNTERYVEQAIVQLLGLKIRAGASKAQLHSFVSGCIEQAMRTNKSLARYHGLDIHRLGSVLRSWYKETKYLTGDGLPRPLPSTGRNSLRSLVKCHYPVAKFEVVFQRLLDTRLIQQVATGEWIPSGRTARIPQLSHETLEHLAEGVSRYVETVTRNVTAKDEKNVLFERSCKVTRLPEKEFPAFRDYVGQQALAFLTAVDDWLESRNQSTQKTGVPLCTAGVYTFAYVRGRDKFS